MSQPRKQAPTAQQELEKVFEASNTVVEACRHLSIKQTVYALALALGRVSTKATISMDAIQELIEVGQDPDERNVVRLVAARLAQQITRKPQN